MVSLADTMCMQVELFISGRKLRNLDTFSKSDPYCQLYELKNNNWAPVGRTEKRKNDLNPDFVEKITVDYYFEKQ